MKTNFKKIESMITANGWIPVRVIGQFCQFKDIKTRRTIVIRNSGNTELSDEVIRNLEKTTGLSLA